MLDNYLTDTLSIENYEIQIFRSLFYAYPNYVFRFSFLTTLDIYKDYLKGCLTGCKGFINAYCDRRQSTIVHFSLEEVAAFIRHRVLWPRNFLIFIMWMNWRTLQPTSFSSWWTYLDPCIDWLVTYCESCIEMRDFHYITSLIVYWDKGSTATWQIPYLSRITKFKFLDFFFTHIQTMCLGFLFSQS